MRYKSISFDITSEVRDLGLNGAYLSMGGLHNRNSDPEFDSLLNKATMDILDDISKDNVKTDKVIQGFRKLHENVEVSNRKNISSPENLLLNILRMGHLARVNLLVDIYNLISLQTRLALGAHDLAKVSGNITLKLTDGSEGYWPLGSKGAKSVRPNCYSYIDDNNDVICWLEVRQVEKTKVTLDTTECFYIIQGNNATDNQHIKSATEQLIELTNRFCGGEVKFLYAPWL